MLRPRRPDVMPGPPDVMYEPHVAMAESLAPIHNVIKNIILPSLINNNKQLLTFIRKCNKDSIHESLLIKSICLGIMMIDNAIGNEFDTKIKDEISYIIDSGYHNLRGQLHDIIKKIKIFLQKYLIDIKEMLITNNDTSRGGKSRNKRGNKKTNRRKTIRRRKNKNSRHKTIRRKSIRRKER